MNQTLVLYKSKYGASKTYAEILQKLLNDSGSSCDVRPIDSCGDISFDDYGQIVFAGGIYASGIAGIRQFEKQCAGLHGKRLAVLCVGASPFDPKALEEIRSRCLSKDGLQDVPLFYARGAWDESRMTFKDRTLCSMLLKAVEKKDPAQCDPWMLELLQARGQVRDWTDESFLQPLATYILQQN